MNRIQVILKINEDLISGDFFQLLKQVQVFLGKWKEEGVLEHLFIRQGKHGSVLVFKDIDEEKVKELMKLLPVYNLAESIEYLNLAKEF